MASSSSPCSMKHQVFLSFRGEDTRFNFAAHLLKALKDTGLNVFFDEHTLEIGEELLPALSRGIAASNLSIIVLSKDYASSNSCLGELSDIMDRKRNPTDKHIVLPIFYHVDPSDVRNIGGTFKTSFKEHGSKRPVEDVKRWKAAFAEIGTLKGWHIEGGKFDRSETEYIKDVVEYVLKKLNSNCKSVSEEFVGIDDQKRKLLALIEQADIRVIGLWGMGGIGKTTLVDVVYKEVSPTFESHWFLQNVSEKIKNKGNEFVRNELLSKLLNEQEIRIDTPSIGHAYQDRLNNKKVLVVLDDVSNPDQLDFMGVKHFGPGSKIIVTSRDRQVLKNGRANHIHEVEKLNEKNSLQLFSTFAFKWLNPSVDFRDLSCKFVEYARGNPLALKVLGSKLYTKSRKEWEGEVDNLKQYAEPEISQVLKSNLDGLRELEKNIFLDIACFFKGEKMDLVEKILSNYCTGAVCGIRNLADKCLLDSIDCYFISMHDMLEEIGKDIVRQECKEDPAKRSRLWFPEDVDQVLRYNKGTASIEGIKLDMSQIDKLQLCSSVFEKMLNLKYIHFYKPGVCNDGWNPKLIVDQVHGVSLPYKLRYFCWDYFPFKTLSNFNSKNLVVLILRYDNMEQLWNEDDHMDLVNLRVFDISFSKKLRKIPNLLGAINLEILDCKWCESLLELPCLNHLASLRQDKFPQVPNPFCDLNLSRTGIEEVPDSIEHLRKLQEFLRERDLNHCPMIKFPRIPRSLIKINLSGTQIDEVSLPLDSRSLRELDLSYCPMVKFPEIPRSLTKLNLSGTQIEEVSLPFDSLCNLVILKMKGSRVKNASIKLESLRKLNLCGCPMVEFPEIPISLVWLNLSGTLIKEVYSPFQPLGYLEDIYLSGTRVKGVLINLESLWYLNLSHCPIKEFPEIPRNLRDLHLSGTLIEEATLTLNSSSSLRYLDMSGSSIQKLQCNISREFPTVDVPSPSLRSKTLSYMCMNRCKSLKLLSELPPYMEYLGVNDCTSLEKLSFADKNLYRFDYLDDMFCMLFCNCFNLNQESIDNIEANAMLKIGFLAEKWAARYDWTWEARYGREYVRLKAPSLICYFPGNKISANKFKCQSMNSSLSLNIAQNGGSGRRFLVFAFCLVADLTHCHHFGGLEYICKYQLTAAGGGNGGGGYEKFRSEIIFLEDYVSEKSMGYHVFILSSMDMVKEDKNYGEASFEFYIKSILHDEEEDYEGEDYHVEYGFKETYIKVERCGVHVFYVDANSDTDATKNGLAGSKRSFSHDGEEGDGVLKRLK
ncbi:disease resistance protein RPV1 isoform X1 [Gossypium hirsutum]|uniref:Disease resistance protein RPV1 isoform X1 n=2 Tax=Gossypium hirsutum TaxID=3635 RepID=A0A1U8HUH9_GOSHI|nr:disease resistance protein RPV1 isoform X1 [Gossypium hirsutum]XP_040934210.1 disease resistance protein RPV1 isoform X1 [Gossypium hirsutum]XP_040934211.1 disease resistance protein RPV1 isoform X1 [Gossypium hirsutum]XP_040934212.1 disease resistance protein RPV1 isoform X1 [Gossypium hirsutum]XP_040934214.1 disease resistance protein RPV1 isoform X1 [Gossypium hirsutum]XP_040934215.1 disease resistance protein RPV1 isoform X1 [Gossypium hirsutum]XP_040934216.1 disease resistance protein